MQSSLNIAPLLPWPLIGGLALAMGICVLLLAWRRARGGWWRAGALALALIALLNPTWVREERDYQKDIVLVAVDRTTSQSIGARTAQTDAALAAVTERLARLKDIEARIITVDGGRQDGTRLFSAIDDEMGRIDRSRLAGTLLITDGQIHDPDRALTGAGPVHALITGQPNEGDRRLSVERAPTFGIVGEPLAVDLRVDDIGVTGAGGIARVTIKVDGKEFGRRPVGIGRATRVHIPIDHAGNTSIEFEVTKGPRELTLINNRAALVINGIRDRLRVLLVSGEPHSGERVWRDMLKADPSVDLVHFTILRPPEKQDGTPIRELSLIAFPTRELFSTKLHQFDLVIFDRYRRRGVLPMLYLDNVARYVEGGGALLVATGPAYAGPESLHRTPIAAVLPSAPTGEQIIGGFKPEISKIGRRHPVTASLAPPPGETPDWGRWFRMIAVEKPGGTVVMTGKDGFKRDNPLLILDRVGEGRVAQLLSDHTWLWARGYEGGGPQAELLRRLAHWLMKEPDLEEERLEAILLDAQVRVTRRTLADSVPPVALTTPAGKSRELTLEKRQPGSWSASFTPEEIGLYRFAQGKLSTVTAIGPLNPREFSNPVSTTGILMPIAEKSGGTVLRIADGLPGLRRVTEGQSTSGRSAGAPWLGLIKRDRYRVTDVSQYPLAPPFLAMLMLVGLAMAAWRAEGR